MKKISLAIKSAWFQLFAFKFNLYYYNLDADGSGAVNRQEFYTAIQELKVEMAPKALKKLWHTIDVDGSGEIKISEFSELLFPEVEGMESDADSDDDDGFGGCGSVVSDPILMKLIMAGVVSP